MAPPPTLRLVDLRKRAALTAGITSVALIGNYPPRRCGIATFTSDVRAALLQARPNIVCDVYAMTDAGNAYAYPPEVGFEIRADKPADYRAAAARLCETRPDVICVEHEFGIFGGRAGEHLLLILEAVDRPVISTLHTVLEKPSEDQRRVFERLLARSAKVVVMAERGRRILRDVWKVADDKIAIIPHGAPDRPLEDSEPFKQALGFAGHDMLFTFGLLSPNKGIETVIRALPEIVKVRPSTLYVVLGATHPHLIATEGERYRQSLQALAADLGVSDHLRLVDAYTDTPKLVNYLQAADVYVTPYLNPAQITSGTLSYAAALGKPIVSTPYWHAAELLADDLGRLAPFGDSAAFGREITGLLCDASAREALRRRIYAASRHTIWSVFGESSIAVFEAAVQATRPLGGDAVRAQPRGAPSIASVRRMTDSCGIFQHSLFDIPDRRHGYCVDDNARALLLMHRLPGPLSGDRRSLIATYAAFVQHAWNPDTGRFRNFMSYERAWLEAQGSEDSTGRAALSVAVSAADARDPAHRRWAQSLMGQVLPHMALITSPRADAFILMGLAALISAELSSEDPRVLERAMARAKLDRLVGFAERRRTAGEPWFEGVLSYDNARLPEACLRAGMALGDEAAVAAGLEALDWLCRYQTGPAGEFLPVATANFGQPIGGRSMFDQQPLEACATIEACEAAFLATADPRWIAEAERAYAWYEGGNTLRLPLATTDGECFDGLTWNSVNENRGAESILSFQLAGCAQLRLTTYLGEGLKAAAE